MEAWDEQVRIRPLPPDPPEGAPPGGTAPPPRRWVPLAVAAGALIVFGVGAAVFGGDTNSPAGDAAGGGAAETTTTTTIRPFANDAPSTTATPTTTVPPTLADLLPGTESGLTAVFRDGRFGTVAHWESAKHDPLVPAPYREAGPGLIRRVGRVARLPVVLPNRRQPPPRLARHQSARSVHRGVRHRVAPHRSAPSRLDGSPADG